MVLEGPADIAVGPAFASRSQGNPLLLRELIQAALARSVLVRRDAVWRLVGPLPLSGGVRELVAERLGGLRKPSGRRSTWWRPASRCPSTSRWRWSARRNSPTSSRRGWWPSTPARPVTMSAPRTRCTATCCAPTCRPFGCDGCGWRWPTHSKRRSRPARTSSCARQSGGSTAGRPTIRRGCSRRRARLAPSASKPPSDWPATRTRPSVRCRRRCCWPRS